MKLREVIRTRTGRYVMIDTCYTWDHGWETMVFACNERGEVIDWRSLDMENYETQTGAAMGHYGMVKKWRERR